MRLSEFGRDLLAALWCVGVIVAGLCLTPAIVAALS